jgi:hypothetical protein
MFNKTPRPLSTCTGSVRSSISYCRRLTLMHSLVCSCFFLLIVDAFPRSQRNFNCCYFSPACKEGRSAKHPESTVFMLVKKCFSASALPTGKSSLEIELSDV